VTGRLEPLGELGGGRHQRPQSVREHAAKVVPLA